MTRKDPPNRWSFRRTLSTCSSSLRTSETRSHLRTKWRTGIHMYFHVQVMGHIIFTFVPSNPWSYKCSWFMGQLIDWMNCNISFLVCASHDTMIIPSYPALQECLSWASFHLGLNPHLRSTSLHQAPNSRFLIHLIEYDPCRPNFHGLHITCLAKAWGELEAEVQRSFISYCCDRFQRNGKARSTPVDGNGFNRSIF